MRDMNLFDQTVQEVQANADKASLDALSSMQDLSYIDLDSRKDNLLNQIKNEQAEEVSGVKDTAANLGKSFVAGGSRTVGSMINAALGLGVTKLDDIPKEAIDAYNRVNHYKDAGITDLKSFKAIYGNDPKYAKDLKAFELLDKPYQTEDGLSVNSTPLGEQVDTALKFNDVSRDVTDFFKDIAPKVKQGNRNQLDKALSETYIKAKPQMDAGIKQLKAGNTWEGLQNVADSATDLIFNGIADGIDNPIAVAEYIAENIPQMLGKKVATVSNIGYGTELYNKAISDYRKENNGAIPSKKRLAEMKAWAVGAAGMEQVSDLFILGKGNSSSALMKATKGLGKPVGSFVSEGSTEAAQSYIEDSGISNKEADPEAIYKSLMVGGLVGSGLSTGIDAGRAVGKGSKVVGKTASDLSLKAADSITGSVGTKRSIKQRHQEDKTIEDAVESGDETKVSDMLGNLEKESAKGAIDIGKKVVSSNVSIDTKQQANEAVTKSINKEVDLYQQLLDEAEKGSSNSKIDSLIKKQAIKVEALKTSAEPIRQAATISSDMLDNLVNELGKKGSGSSTKAAKRIFNSFKANNDSVTDEQLDTLVKSGELSSQENQQINSYRTVTNLINTLKGTKKEVLEGGYNEETKRYMFGLKDYRDMVMSGNVEQGLKGLKNFADIHTAKAEKFEQDFEKVKDSNERITYPDGSYIGSNSNNLIQQVRKEADALNQAYTELSKIKNSNVDDIETKVKEEPELAKAVDNIIKPKNKLRSKIHTVPTNNPVVNVVKHNRNTYKVFKDGSAINVGTGKNVRNKKVLAKLNAKKVIEDINNGTSITNTDTTADTGSNIPKVSKQVSIPKKVKPNDISNISATTDSTVQEPVKEQREVLEHKSKNKLRGNPNNVKRINTKESLDTPSTLEDSLDYSMAQELVSQPNDDTKFIGEQNLISKYFKVGNKKDSVLDKVRNFMQVLMRNPNKTLEDKFGELSETRLDIIDSFDKFHDKFVAGLNKEFKVNNLVSTRTGHIYNQNDYVQSLVVNGVLPENIKTAMAVAAYQWLTANGRTSTISTEESIRDILNLNDDDVFPTGLYKLFNNGGIKQSDVINDIGKDVLRSLNLKPSNNGLEYSETNLAHALGAWTFGAMRTSNYLFNHKDIPVSDVKKLYGKSNPIELKDGTYIKLVSGKNFKSLVETNQKDSSFIGKIFGIESLRPLPDTEVPKVNTKKTKTNQVITKKTEDTLKKDQERGSTLNTSLVENLEDFDENLMLSMAGYTHDTTNLIKSLKDSVDSKNKSIKEELDIFQEMKAWVNINDGLDTIFHYAHNVWKNDRMGLSNSFNPQSSKIHRYLQHRVDWETEIILDDSHAVNWFKLAVAQGFDIVADKQSDADALEQFNKKIAEPIIRTGIDAMKARINGDTSIETQQLITDAVIAGKEKFATLNAINSYAEYELALENPNQTTFTHAMAREVDGITNGVAITAMQFAHNNLNKMFKMLNRMGFFRDGKSFAQFNKEGNQDSYKTLAKSWNTEITKQLEPNLKEAYTASQVLLGSFLDDKGEVTKEGRNLAKPPLMQSIYGASIDSIIESIGRDAIEKLYKNLQKSYDSYVKNGSKDTKKFLGEANKQLELYTVIAGVKPKAFTSVKEVVEFELKSKDIDLFNDTIKQIYSKSLFTAMQEDYSQVFDVRSQVNNAANLITLMSKKLYEQRKNEIINAKVKANPNLDITEQVLTVKEKRELDAEMKSLMPYVNTASSFLLTPKGENQLKEQLDSALYLSKRSTKVVDNKKAFTQIKLSGAGGYGKSLETLGIGDSIGLAGVGTIPILTHSQDALVQLIKMGKVSGLNVHDAEYMGYKNYTEQQQHYNESLMFVLKNYNPVLEVSRTFDRVFAEFKKHPKLVNEVFNSAEGNKFIKNIAGTEMVSKDGTYTYKVLPKNLSPLNAFTKATSSINILGNELQTNKLNVIKELTNVEQYRAGDGGAYTYPKLETVTPTTQAKRVFKSTGEVENLNEAEYTVDKDVDKKSLKEVFDFMVNESIDVDSSNHLEHLSNIVTNVGTKVVEPFKLKYGTNESSRTVGDTDGSTIRIINTVKGALTPSSLLTDGNMSAAEVFTHELVHNLTQVGLSIDTLARGQINKLWKQAKDNKKLFNPEMFLPEGIKKTDATYEDELKIATVKYNHIFKIRKDSTVNGRAVSNHLHEFVTYGMTNAKFRAALSQVKYSSVKRRTGNTLTDNLYNAFGKMIDTIYNYIIGSKGKSADRQLDELFRTLANVDSKNKTKIKNVINKIGSPVIKTKAGISKAMNPVTKVGSKLAKDLSKPTELTVNTLWSVLRKEMHSSTNVYINGLAKVLVTEAEGRTEYNGIQHDIRRVAQKEIDQERESIRITVAEALNSAFKQKLTKEMDKVLFKVLGKTDLATLRNLIGSGDMVKAVTDSNFRDSLIAQYTLMLKGLNHGDFYVSQAKNLGKFMITGKNGLPKGLLNSLAISELAGTKFKRPVNARAVAKDIDVLASLIALDTVQASELSIMGDLLNTEYEGVSFSLDLMDKFHEDSKTDFLENPYSMIKGYMRDMTNPDIDVKAGYYTEKALMESKGYIMKEQLPKDESDPSDKPRYLFVNNFGGKAAFLQGNMYMNSDTAKGTDVIGSMEEHDPDAFAKMEAFKNKEVAKKGYSYTVPVLNSERRIVGYRYIMSEVSKEHYLGNKPSFTNSFSMMAGDIAVKQNMKETNKEVINALFEQYKEDFSKNSEMYVKISPFHPDEKIREIYAMLPRDAKEYAAQAFKGLPLVRKDQIDLLFGYRKYSIRETLAKNPKERLAVNNLLIGMLTKVCGGTPSMWAKVVTAENTIQEIVKYVKDVIVIRSAIVTIGNTYSNLQQLWLSGVSLKDIVTNYTQAFEAYRKYKKFDKERRLVALKLQNKILSDKAKKKLETQLIKLEDELVNNPLTELIDNGVLPNIVEDMAVRVDDFSVKGKGIEKLQGTKVFNKATKFVDSTRLGKPVLNVGKELLAMEGSQMHKMLSDAAMFSDFGARYVLFKHLTTKKNEPLNSKEAMGRVMQEFINYDLPTERTLQYLNDIGAILFTKYFIRIQRVILNMFTEHAGSIILKLLAMNMLNFDTPDIIGSNLLDKSIMNNIGNPVSSLMDAPSNLYSHKAMESII